MGTPSFVLRSVHPERTAAAVRAADAARAAAVDAINAVTDELFPPDPGPKFTARVTMMFDQSISAPYGFTVVAGITSRQPVPEGMRYDQKSRELVPAKRTDEGKALAKRLAPLSFTYPQIDGLGGIVTGSKEPASAGEQRQRFFTGWSFVVYDSPAGPQVFACLPVAYPDERDLAQADPECWAPARLSEYHSAREQAEESGQ